MTLGDALGVVSIGLVAVGFGLTWVLYRLDQAAAEDHDVEAARALLCAVRDGTPWGNEYFQHAYDDAGADARAHHDYVSVSEGSYGEIFEVPTEPVAALLGGTAASRWIDEPTVEAASVALWHLGTFNQLVRQKSDFNRSHLLEFYDAELPKRRRELLAIAAEKQSRMLHRNGVGDTAWYHNLRRQISANIDALDATLRTRRHWWNRLRRL